MSDLSMTAARIYEVSIFISGLFLPSLSHPVFRYLNFSKLAPAKLC